MKCPNCGMELEADARFCGSCGSKVPETVPVQEQTTVQEPQAGVPTQSEQNSASDQGMQAQNEIPPVQNGIPPVNMTPPQNIPPNKKGHGKLIGAIAAVAAVAAVGVGGFFFFQNMKPNTEKQIVYVKDGVLYYTANMDKEKEPIEIYDGHEDSCGYNAKLSKDQQYLFFICGEDSSQRLYRVKLQKLTANEEKNEKYIEEIDSHVYGYKPIDSGNALYYRDEDFYYYDGKETTEIDKDVTSNYRSGDSVYYLKSKGSSDETLCHFNLESREVTEIGDCSNVYDYNENEILYVQGDMDDYDLYLAKTGEKPIKLAEEISVIDSSDLESGVIYYLKKAETQMSYYDFVEDPYAEEDAKVSEPDVKDFLKETSAKKALDEYRYEAYKEYKDDFYDYYCIYSEDYGMYMYYDYDYDSGDEYYYLIDADKQIWYKLDYEGYQEAYESYEMVSDRIELREELKEETYEEVSYDLYCYTAKDGEKLVMSSVSDSYSNAKNRICVYQKQETGDNKVCSIDDIDYVSQVDSYLYNEESQNNEAYYLMIDGKEQELDSHITSAGFDVSDDGKNIMFSSYTENGGELYAYENKAGEAKKVGKVCSDYNYGYWDGEMFYYCTNSGDYCVYKNGKSKTILEDVQDAVCWGDGVYTAYTDFKNNENNKLMLFHEKDESLVDRDVETYSFINENRIVYMKNGDLYVYLGEDKNRRIDRDVSDFCCDDRGIVWE